MPPIKKLWQDMGKIGINITAPFDVEREAHVFLYFPSDAPEARATAAFLAINTEFQPVGQPNAQGKVLFETPDDHDRLFLIAANIWNCLGVRWRRHHPDVLDRIEPGRLAVIMSFRETACGFLWDTDTQTLLGVEKERMMINLTKIT